MGKKGGLIMKIWWKIHDKPRGRWRPTLSWGVNFTKEEINEMQQLNIDTQIKYCFLVQSENNISIPQYCPKKNRIIIVLPEPFYRDRDIENNRKAFNYSICSECPYSEYVLNEIIADEKRINIDTLGISWSFFLPWRPGARPDYSDFIEPVRNFLKYIVNIIENRLQEARESSPSDEWLLEEEIDAAMVQEEQHSDRKLRVVRI
jgi:hypothetical protein